MSTAAKNIYGKDWQNGVTYAEWDALDSDGVNLIAGSGYAEANWVTAIRFEISDYAGSVTFNWRTGSRYGSGTGVMKYKLTDKEDSSLVNANYNTAADGTFTAKLSELGTNKLTITRTLAPGTYYLYIWQGAAAASFTSVYFFTGSYGMTINYEDIPGTASSIALTGGVLGSPVKIQITRDNADFVHTLNWSFAGQSGVIAEKTGDTIVTWTPDADTFGAYIPTASSGTLTVSCTTYYGSEQIGTAQTATLTLSVPSDAAPTVSSGWASVSYSNSGTAAEGIAACIAGYSKAVVTFDESKVTAKYGATVKTLTAAMGGSSVTGSGTIGTVSGTDNTVTLTATDSRGKKTSQNVALSAYAYSRPVLGGVTVFRCSSAGAEDDSGAYYSAGATVTYSTAGGKISCALTAAVKAVGGNYGTAAALTPGTASVLGGGLSATVSYIVRIRAVDTLGNAAAVEVMIPTAAVAFHIPDGGSGLGLGKYNESPGAVDSAWPIKMNGNRITGLGEPTEDGDAVPLEHIQALGYGGGALPWIDVYNIADETVFGSKADEILATMPNYSARQVIIRDYPTLGGNSYVATLFKYNASYAAVVGVGYGADGSNIVRKTKLAGVWQPWEHTHPPMNVGVEYRTTERFRGKAVYAKVIDAGALPNSTYKNVAHGISPLTGVVLVTGTTEGGANYMPSMSDAANLDLYINAVNVRITTKQDWSGGRGYIFMKYTKD